jgi:hypothetical protein
MILTNRQRQLVKEALELIKDKYPDEVEPLLQITKEDPNAVYLDALPIPNAYQLTARNPYCEQTVLVSGPIPEDDHELYRVFQRMFKDSTVRVYESSRAVVIRGNIYSYQELNDNTPKIQTNKQAENFKRLNPDFNSLRDELND